MPVGAADGRQALVLAEAALKSHRTGRPVKVPAPKAAHERDPRRRQGRPGHRRHARRRRGDRARGRRRAAPRRCASPAAMRRAASRVAKDIEAKFCPTLFVAADLGDADACRAHRRAGAASASASSTGWSTPPASPIAARSRTPASSCGTGCSTSTRARPFILIQEMVRRLQAAKRPGSIVNIITRSSHGGQPFLTAYSSSKGALAILTKNVAHAVRSHRIRVNGLNIGWTETPGEHAIQKRDGKPADWLAARRAGAALRPPDQAARRGDGIGLPAERRERDDDRRADRLRPERDGRLRLTGTRRVSSSA